MAKLLETQEQEIEDGRASKVSLQHLVTKLNEDREVKNAEILRMKVTGSSFSKKVFSNKQYPESTKETVSFRVTEGTKFNRHRTK